MKRILNEPFTLALSSGFFGFYAHVGFMKALEEFGLTPAIYTGSSAGAIIAAASARGMNTREIEKLTIGVSRDLFWDPAIGFGFLKGRKLEELIRREIASDFNELKAPLRISVFDILSRKTVALSQGSLAKAVRASCAVPLMFHPVRIDGRLYWDGGIADKMAICDLPTENLVLSHYLESRSVYGAYEISRDRRGPRYHSENLVRIQLAGLPTAGPFALHRGPNIIEQAYRQTKEKLKADLTSRA